MKRPHSEQEYLLQNFRYLLVLRSIAIVSMIVALLFMSFSLHIQLPLLAIALIIITLMIYTIRSWHLQQLLLIQGKTVFLQQLIVDVLSLSLLVYFTGGSTNPFIFFFLLPITFAAATLDFYQTCVVSLLAGLSYTLLMFFHVPLAMHHHAVSGFDIHIWGMWYGFIISASLVTYFVSRIGSSLRKRDKALASAREQNLQAEQILALGSLAAGTAHELGTPLSTLAILIHDLELEHQDDKELHGDLLLARQQIDRCKNILSKMATDAGLAQADTGGSLTLEDYLGKMLDDWQSLRPDAKLKTRLLNHSEHDIQILSDHTVTQAIHNVLSNADDACQSEIQCLLEWDTEQLEISIIDDGPGFSDDIRQQLGKPIAHNIKGHSGMGIGLFLSQITFNRLGGHMQIDNTLNGTEVKIQLPLASLTTSEQAETDE